MPVIPRDDIAHKILRWFEANARELPWRNPPGAPLPLDDPDWPYRVWLSEIMLQQTTVAAATPYFLAFLSRWPSVTALAEAEDAAVMKAWAGLGYYARARNLLACARTVAKDHGGRFPSVEAALRTLPGIGAYTAAAIAAFAFGQDAVIVDGNIERVTARLFAIHTPMPKARAEIAVRVAELTPKGRAGDFAQGLMDLARTICTPRSPKCLICPIADACAGRAEAERFPVKPPKAAKPERFGHAWWIEREGMVLIERRPAKGLLGGMMGLPGTEWRGEALTEPSQGTALGTVTHVFTHFRLTLTIVAMLPEKGCATQPGGEWWPVNRIEDAGLPSLFAKAARLAIATTESV